MPKHFELGTERDGFKKSLMAAFQSAHKKASGGTHPTQVPHDKMTGFNPDRRPHELMPGGNQAFKMPASSHGDSVLDGGRHPSPAATARGPIGHNNDPRKTGLEVAGNQTTKIKMPSGLQTASNGHGLEPAGHQANKIKLPKGQNVDSRSLRGR